MGCLSATDQEKYAKQLDFTNVKDIKNKTKNT